MGSEGGRGGGWDRGELLGWHKGKAAKNRGKDLTAV
jgi:hypothetical protein